MNENLNFTSYSLWRKTTYNFTLLNKTGKQHVSQVANEISMVQCGKTRFDLHGNMEVAAYGMDSLPNMVITELEDADDACRSVQNFFVETSSKLTQGVETVLKLASGKFQDLHIPFLQTLLSFLYVYVFGKYKDKASNDIR